MVKVVKVVKVKVVKVRVRVSGTDAFGSIFEGNVEWVKTNPLNWWKKHELTFPRLAKLARAYLALPATSAPSERIFSQASLVLAKRRTRLDPEMAGKLLCVKKNWDAEEKAGWDMLEAVRGSVEEQELEEVVEAEAAAQPHVEPNLEELDLEDLDFEALNIGGNDVAEG